MKRIRSRSFALIGLLTLLAAWLILPVDAAQAQRRRERDREQQDNAAAEPSDAERTAIAEIMTQFHGAIVYSRRDHIRKQVLGKWQAVDLGTGDAARWSPDGARIAVYDGGAIFVMNADGSERRKLYDDADDLEDGSPIEFHTNGEEILFARKRTGLWSVRIADGEVRQLALPAKYTGEPGMSVDGKRLVARLDNDLYAVDLAAGKHRKFGRGCGPSVSPSGEWIANNLGSHRQMAIQRWNGDELKKLDAQMRPDRSWDDFHWSNHEDYLTVQGERSREEAYIINVRTGDAVRATWEGAIRMPDLFVTDAVASPSPSSGEPTTNGVEPSPTP